MGRRAINTTKSGKYMNPTDQHRKEARKKELKKNKKQRMIVRAAVLKGKDPHQILADMERLDQMEYNVNGPTSLNEKVLKDKRRKLKETWDRLCRLYVKEDHEKFLELKRLEAEYDLKKGQMVKFYEAVKSAEEVVLDDIPLPAAPMDPNMTLDINFNKEQPTSILKRSTQKCTHKEPPGVPPGPPPVISDTEEDSEDDSKDKNKKVRFGEAGHVDKEADISEFLKEIEDVSKTGNKNDDKNENLTASHVGVLTNPRMTLQGPSSSSLLMIRPTYNSMPPPPRMKPLIPPGVPNLNHRPGVPLMVQQMRPPGMHLPTRIHGTARGALHGQPLPRPPHPVSSNVGKKDDKKNTHFVVDKATIEAKPQLRNLSADATRFTPVSLRVKRTEKFVKKVNKTAEDCDPFSFSSNSNTNQANSLTKDDAYQEFMKELQTFL